MGCYRFYRYFVPTGLAENQIRSLGARFITSFAELIRLN